MLSSVMRRGGASGCNTYRYACHSTINPSPVAPAVNNLRPSGDQATAAASVNPCDHNTGSGIGESSGSVSGTSTTYTSLLAVTSRASDLPEMNAMRRASGAQAGAISSQSPSVS